MIGAAPLNPPDLSRSPTLAAHGTRAGVMPGTASRSAT